MNKKQLQARLKAINEKCTIIVAAADKDNAGAMTPEQQTQFDTLTAEYETVSEQLGRVEALEKQTQHLNSSAGRGTAPAAPGVHIEGQREQRDPTGGFVDMAQLALAVRGVRDNGVDPRLKALTVRPDVQGAPTNFHNESGSDGYEVPPAFRDAIWQLAFGTDDLLSMVDSEPTDSNSVDFIADETTPWGSTGIQANWESEGGQMDPSRLATKGRQLKLHKLYAFVLASDELLADAARLASRLTSGAARAINWKANQAIVEGTGAGQPLGYSNSGSLVSVAKETSQVAGTIVAQNIAKMYSRVLNPEQSVWRMNSDAFPEIMTMTLGNEPIWVPPSSSFQNAPGGFLLGRPIQFSEHCETVGTVGDIELVNPKGYYCPLKRGGVQYASSIHLYFDYGVQAFRWTFRMGGQPYLSAPVTPNKGSNTKSHFVRLATRS